jgi:hypothetical protein
MDETKNVEFSTEIGVTDVDFDSANIIYKICARCMMERRIIIENC